MQWHLLGRSTLYEAIMMDCEQWHFYEKAREMGLEFGAFKWREKEKAMDAVDANVRDQMDGTYPRFTGALVCLF